MNDRRYGVSLLSRKQKVMMKKEPERNLIAWSQIDKTQAARGSQIDSIKTDVGALSFDLI